MAGGITPIILGYILIDQLTKTVSEGYNDMPQWFVNTFGWGMAAGDHRDRVPALAPAWSRHRQAFTSRHRPSRTRT